MSNYSSNEEPVTLLETAAQTDSDDHAYSEDLANNPPPVVVFKAGSTTEGEIIRGLLESEGIPATYNPNAASSLPGISLSSTTNDETFCGIVEVSAEDEVRALELIAEYSKPISDAEIEADEEGE